MSRIALGVVAALSLCAAAPALAQRNTLPSATHTGQRVVPHGDLNLDSAAGADAMLGRINSASRFVCGDRSGPRTVQENGGVHVCIGETMDNAVADLGNPNVSNRYYGNTPEVIIGDDEDAYGYPDKGK